jgi:hypothetical protein
MSTAEEFLWRPRGLAILHRPDGFNRDLHFFRSGLFEQLTAIFFSVQWDALAGCMCAPLGLFFAMTASL